MLLAALLAAAPAAPPKAHVRQVLRDQCLVFAADVRNAWGLAHGITALGPSFVASDGRRAADVIVADYLMRNLLLDGGVGPGAPYGFLRYLKDGTPVEPHSNLLTKTLVLSGLPLSTSFKTAWGGTVTLAQLSDGVKRGFRHVPDNEEYWRDVGWTLDLISETSKPGATFTTDDGARVSVDAVMDDALAYLERADADLEAGMKKSLPQVDKRKQGIYGHSCGGLHLVQAVLGWARHPEVRRRWGARLDTQLAVLFYRLESERRQYEAALQAAPQFTLQVLTQMVKFYGHFLETTGRVRAEWGWKPTDAQRQAVERSRALLDAAVRQLEAVKAFESMDRLKTAQPQIYLDLIGDSCHAAHGWDLWP